ncbi:MAG: SOS response-associated peptidase [Alphaproteobacteria bacterium]|nr:MAG: SOS response-associated peptidase [Alphaproteobacteria bacterium]
MCGRYSQNSPIEKLRDVFGVTERFNFPPSYNIAPTQYAPIVRFSKSKDRGELTLMRWGLIPFWAKDITIGNKLINARAETLAEKPSFRGALKYRRCIIPADGFYEWQKQETGKQPFNIRRKNCEPMGFAGLWEEWGEDRLQSFTIITTAANNTIKALHDRMPVILPPDDYAAWLEKGDTALLTPCPDDWLETYPVNKRVNSPANNDASLLDPLPQAN